MNRSGVHSGFSRSFYPMYFRGQGKVNRIKRWVDLLDEYLTGLEEQHLQVDRATVEEVLQASQLLQRGWIRDNSRQRDSVLLISNSEKCLELLQVAIERIQAHYTHIHFCLDQDQWGINKQLFVGRMTDQEKKNNY